MDARHATDLCERLESAGIQCWIAPRDPISGLPYAQQLVSAIETTRVLLLVFSSNANTSRAVLNELELASNRGKFILPVRIEDVLPSAGVEFYVRAIHWFDAATRPLDAVWPQLLAHVHRLIAQDVPEFPAGPSGSKRSNLPQQLTSFVGREKEASEVEELIEHERLVTLVASGGAGKTRLAIQVAADVIGDFDDGVWFAELAAVVEPSLVVTSIARVFDVQESGGTPLLDILVTFLQRRRLLLVIDNCEQVIEEVRKIASAILRACPHVRVIATSRESLNVAGEQVYRLPPLEEDGALELFVERARSSDSRFELTDSIARFVHDICRRLDGIPLAIELAAARINVLSPEQIAQKLDERFRVLTGGDRSALPRHQTMRALIDWSYDLLTEAERALFRRVSVFAGPFTLAGAAAVCDGAARDEIEVLDVISSLINKSLLQTNIGAEPRYRMLETTRAYARDKLAELGELEPSADRHLQYVAELFRETGKVYETSVSGSVLARLSGELEEIRAAFEWALRGGKVEAGADLFLAAPIWDLLGLYREATERAQRLLSLVSESDYARRAALLARIASWAGRTGHYSGLKESAEEALRLARASKNDGILADTLLFYADFVAHLRQFDEALAAIDEAESLPSISTRRRIRAVHNRGLIAMLQGDTETATQCFAQMRDLYASLGNTAGAVSAALNLAEMEHARGATREAVAIVTKELPRAEGLPGRTDWAFALCNLAGYLDAVDDAAGAQRAAREALAFYAERDPESAYTAVALEHLALALALEGGFEPAAIIEGYVHKTLAELGYEREHTEQTTHARLREILAAKVSKDSLAALLARGERMKVAEVLENAALEPA